MNERTKLEKLSCFYCRAYFGVIAFLIQMALINVKIHGSTYAMAKIWWYWFVEKVWNQHKNYRFVYTLNWKTSVIALVTTSHGLGYKLNKLLYNTFEVYIKSNLAVVLPVDPKSRSSQSELRHRDTCIESVIPISLITTMPIPHIPSREKNNRDSAMSGLC